MNPETNKMEPVPELDEFRNRFYPGRELDDTPTFEIYERIKIKGYFFKVIQMREDKLVLAPVGPAPKKEKEKDHGRD